jgi:predicted secreted protein with PEFG-CTERM motif
MQRPRTSQFLAYALILTLVGSVISLAIPTFQPSYASHKNISVEIDHDIDEPYGQSDDVVISGSIDEVEDDEDTVTIKIKSPTGATIKTLTSTLDDDGNFDDSYSISGTAADGVYAIEVDYNGEKVYSFFVVDEDSKIIVETDETSYQGGDEITVSGQVDDVVDGEDDVQITIIDANNVKILNEEDVTLGDGGVDDDEFEFTFDDLDSDADHGRYAVIVSYDSDDQQGFALFEVEDPDAGSGDNISAEMSDDTYAPGDTVSLSGTIDDTDSSTDLEIVVKDPDNHIVSAYGDDNVAVASNGDFDYDFDLEDDADEGKYTVTITYGSDDLKLDFTVDEDAGSSTTAKLTVKLNKTSFLAGDSIIVTGTVPKIVNDEDVNVLAYDKDSIFTGASQYVTPSSDKTYSATLKLKSDLKVQDGYQVRVNYNGEEVKATFSITGQTEVLTVKTDKPKYDIGSTVKITGQVASGSIVSGMKVLIQVYNPDDAAYRIDPVDVSSDGSFSYSMPVGGDLGVPGTYEVKATYNGKQVKTTFDIGSSSTAYNLKAGSKTYPIQYGISSGTIKSMFVQTADNKLVIAVDATEDGQLTLVLPREVIDAIQEGKDIPFVVATTDLEAGAGGNADIDESSTNGSTRTVVIDYKKGTDLIEISGTSVVPEFGAISAIVLAIAIVGIIMATARFGGKFNFMRQ